MKKYLFTLPFIFILIAVVSLPVAATAGGDDDGDADETVAATSELQTILTEAEEKAAAAAEALRSAGESSSVKIHGGLMALTFDDGPSANTEKLLDELKKRNIKATFFVVGERLEEFSDLLKREYDEGHEVANHSWNHANFAKLSAEEVKNQVTMTNDAISEIVGADIGDPIVRPPYGSVNETVRSALSSEPLILWSVDTLDWKSRNADAVQTQIVNQAADGAIILMHDLYDTTVDGCIAAIDELTAEGYTFVTVSELFRRKGQTLSGGTTYNNADYNGVDLGPAPIQDDADEDTQSNTTQKKKTDSGREDKGFPWGWLAFCLVILAIYGTGLVRAIRDAAPAPRPRKDPSHAKTAPRSRADRRYDRPHSDTASRRRR